MFNYLHTYAFSTFMILPIKPESWYFQENVTSVSSMGKLLFLGLKMEGQIEVVLLNTFLFFLWKLTNLPCEDEDHC
jgi:hypothetical protein